jgi:glycosyltransferase involved in cell wall biosynthesis
MLAIAHVSTFPNMRCGIATYANDLIESMPSAKHVRYALHYGLDNSEGAAASANNSSTSELKELALRISNSDCDIVSLQHEFGIWGGDNGEHIFAFLDALSRPLVSTLHTTFPPLSRPAIQIAILRRIVEQSRKVVVLTDSSKRSLAALLLQDYANIDVIPHGVPAVPLSLVDELPGLSRTACRLVSVGFFRPDKGIETTLVALWKLKKRGYDVAYTIAGEAQRQFADQAHYQVEVAQLVRRLNLQHQVHIIDKYLSVDEQIDLIQHSHAGIFAYQTPEQSSSGTIPLVFACGRPVICTPYEYAIVKRTEGMYVTVARNFGAEALADSIAHFLALPQSLRLICEDVHRRAQKWVWPVVAARYQAEYEHAIRQSA